ncbi:hypothetical protein IEO21_09923 [Rhodonia placenta]|uniref:C2H2-type domain-containing protein n=1 Tax=Rhodonia placenta TaxID=104341 RepID=A0A8H7NTK4_9APHY|nr:hypothetical protein IEO21_09923 [Postia placenta]
MRTCPVFDISIAGPEASQKSYISGSFLALQTIFALNSDLFQLHRPTNFYPTHHIASAPSAMASDPFLEFCDKLKELESAGADEWSFFSQIPAELAKVNEPENAEDSSDVPDLQALVQEMGWDLPPLDSEEVPSFESGISGVSSTEMPPRSSGSNTHVAEPTYQPAPFFGYPWPTYPAAAPYFGVPYGCQPTYIEGAMTPTAPTYWYPMGYNYGLALHGPHVTPYGVTSAPMSGLQYVGQTMDNIDYTNNGYGYTATPAPDTHRPRSKKARTRFRQPHVVRKPRTWTPAARNYQCSHCHEWFSRSGVRDRHITTGCTNGKQKEWQCPICLKMYSRTDSRGRHCHSQHGMSYKDAVEWVKERLSDRDPSENEGSPAPLDDY